MPHGAKVLSCQGLGDLGGLPRLSSNDYSSISRFCLCQVVTWVPEPKICIRLENELVTGDWVRLYVARIYYENNPTQGSQPPSPGASGDRKCLTAVAARPRTGQAGPGDCVSYKSFYT